MTLPETIEPQATTTSDDRNQWYAWMDFFRTAAALVVVVSHARDIVVSDYTGKALYAPFYAATGLGHSGVVVFFVLSGFWISRTVLRRIDDAHFWKNYLIDRLSRLLIVLVPALALGGLLDWIGAIRLGLPIYSGVSGSHSIIDPVIDHLRPEVLLGNLLFLQKIAVPTWGSNGPLWSLAYEFWFYVWFPALALLVSRRRISVALAGLAVAWFNPDVALGFLVWLVGLVLLQTDRPRPDQGASPWMASAAAMLFVAVLLLSGVRHGFWVDFVLAVSFALLLHALHISKVALPRVFEPLARYGRDSSYSLYVVHFPVLALIGSLVTGGMRMAPSPTSVGIVVTLAAMCALTGWLFSTFTERNTGEARSFLHRRFG